MSKWVDVNGESEAWMLERMKKTPKFTAHDLWGHFGGYEAPQYRLADRLLQRERKAGRIVQTQQRGVWRLAAPTEATLERQNA